VMLSLQHSRRAWTLTRRLPGIQTNIHARALRSGTESLPDSTIPIGGERPR
jgi:hypothetical protein